jgi:hypothetical protein
MTSRAIGAVIHPGLKRASIRLYAMIVGTFQQRAVGFTQTRRRRFGQRWRGAHLRIELAPRACATRLPRREWRDFLHRRFPDAASLSARLHAAELLREKCTRRDPAASGIGVNRYGAGRQA